ncbi:response regulator transcription factor [Streptomyces sp. NBC_00988]|uniref:response regulator transcription factor n=1 Tax=Streptomyces sp. NBC_00988 TaxID=2903704 RepID=UPI0038632FDB
MARLTERGYQVLGVFATGLANDDIAKRLYLSTYTAKAHCKRLMAEVGARDRTQLVVGAYQTGFTRS